MTTVSSQSHVHKTVFEITLKYHQGQVFIRRAVALL